MRERRLVTAAVAAFAVMSVLCVVAAGVIDDPYCMTDVSLLVLGFLGVCATVAGLLVLATTTVARRVVLPVAVVGFLGCAVGYGVYLARPVGELPDYLPLVLGGGGVVFLLTLLGTAVLAVARRHLVRRAS